MAKSRDTIYFCTECGYETAKWAGQCPACHNWNTLTPGLASRPSVQGTRRGISSLPDPGSRQVKPSTISDIDIVDDERTVTGIEEFDRVLGGGVVKGALILVGGDPGIGKSTLLTQVCKVLSDKGIRVLYVSGEESLRQIKLRAERIGSFTDSMKLLSETDIDVIEKALPVVDPQVLVIDSIQTMYRNDVSAAPGSIGQVRECTNVLMQWAKVLNIAVFVVGHVTKEGVVAGPRLLEHMVDTVLYFEGDSHASYRVLRGVKNRFGSTNEIGVFEMRSTGLVQVPNPSEFMLSGRPTGVSGTVVSCCMEGTRPILAEIQALVTRSGLNNPRRSSTGIDFNRMNLLMAVLEKRLGFHMSECDVYVNIAGGMKISETAADLAVILALASGYLDFVIPSELMAVGEVGLSGEVRSVNQTMSRVREAAKMGFNTCMVPEAAVKSLGAVSGIKLLGVSNAAQAIEMLRNGIK